MDQKLRLWLLRHRMGQMYGTHVAASPRAEMGGKTRRMARLGADRAAPIRTDPRGQMSYQLGIGGHLDEVPPRSRPESTGFLKYQAALESLACELARVRETERQKIAERLHDEFGQDLVVAKMKLGQLAETLPRQYEGCVSGIAEIISDLIRRTRTVMHELSPRPLCETGLKGALQSLAREIQTKHDIACSAKLDSMPAALTEEAQQILLRAVRELLFNVVKHARASRANVVVTRKPGAVTIEVTDNGQGFDRHNAAFSDLSVGRFGLSSVGADLATIGAELDISSRLGKGTKAAITVPLAAA